MEPGAVYGVAQSRTQLKRLSSSSLKGEKSEQRHRTVFEFEGKMLPYAWRTSSSCRREQGHQCRSRASQADHDKPAGQGHTWITHITWISWLSNAGAGPRNLCQSLEDSSKLGSMGNTCVSDGDPGKLWSRDLIEYRLQTGPLTESWHHSLPSGGCCLVAILCPALLWPRGLWPTRLLCPWDFPGKNTGVGCHFLPLLGYLSLFILFHIPYFFSKWIFSPSKDWKSCKRRD